MKLLIILLFISLTTYSQSKYSITKELPPLSISYSQLEEIISSAIYLIKKYDSTFSNGDFLIKVTLDNEFQTFDNIEMLNQIKFDKAYEFSFDFSNYNGQVTVLRLDFSDNTRVIEIEGQNYLELQTIISQIERPLLKEKIYIGGPGFRYFSGFILFAIGLFLIESIKLSEGEKQESRNSSSLYLRLIVGFLLIILVLLAGLTDIFSIHKIFSGFVAIRSDASFISRNADVITVMGIVLSLIGLPIFQKIRVRVKKQ